MNPPAAAASASAAAGQSPAEIDAAWRRDVYRGEGEAQLTLRGTLTGMLLGAVMALSNLYVGLKTGWAFSVAITSCVLSFALWRGIVSLRLARAPLGMLETNCMQSTASAAGYTSAAVMITAVPAYLMITGLSIKAVWLVLWAFFVSMLGMMLVIPLKRQIINYEQLKFPTGIAMAETLRGFHEHGEQAVHKARALFSAMGVGALAYWLSFNNTFTWWRLPRIPELIVFPGRLQGLPLAQYTVGFDLSGVSLAAGALIGVRTTLWMLGGSAISYLLVAPRLLAAGQLTTDFGYSDVQGVFSLWIGSALMIGASLTDLVFQRHTVGRALMGVGALFRRNGNKTEEDPLADIEIPGRWFPWGVGVSLAGILLVAHLAFAIRWPIILVALVLTFVFILVSVRAAGETDIIPVGQLGKLAQLSFGGLAPGRLSTNLMATSITTSAAASATDLMVNLRCGNLIGANPRRQFVAQFLGVFVGTLVVVPAFTVLVPHASMLGTPSLPAPAAAMWRAIAELMSDGLGALGGVARWGLLIGFASGCLFSVLGERVRGHGRWVPSSFGLGLGMVITFSQSFSFVIGALIVMAVRRLAARPAAEYTVPVASGLIAGESLLGVLLAALAVLGLMPME